MSHNWKKWIAFMCTLALVMTLVPAQAQAATKKPAFVKSYTSLYENDTNKGVYTYTVKNLVKGQKVRWSVSGTGKSYVKLQKATTTVAGTTSVNKLTVRTNKKVAAKNKTVIVKAKVYSKNGKLQTTLTARTGKIKVYPTKIEVLSDMEDDEAFLVGKTYQMRFRISPANATSTNVWSVLDASGNTVDYITRTGAFTPEEEGAYVIHVEAKVGSKVIAEDSLDVNVSTTMTGVKQTAVNELVVTYSGNAKNVVKTENLEITNANNAKIVIQNTSFSSDGKEITLTTSSKLKDGAVYKVTDGVSAYEVIARVGKPVTARILNSEVTVNKTTPIVYALYDTDGINVTAAYPGTVVYTADIRNGYLTNKNEIFMNTIGKTGSISMTYTSDDKSIVLENTAIVTCIAASTSNDTNLTFTDSELKPDYGAGNYKDVRNIVSGKTYYVHFRALDEDKTEVPYNSLKFESSDPDMLIINQSSKGIVSATAIKTGTVNVTVTALYGKDDYTYQYEVTISEPAYLAGLTLSRNVISMSNVSVSGYHGYLNVEGRDQYGQVIPLQNETVTITDNNVYKTNMATYDMVNKRIVINATGKIVGTYQYTITLVMNGRKTSADFTIVVQNPPYNGASSYAIEMDQPVLDLQMGSGMTSTELLNSKKVTVRIAEYRGGIFYNYVPIQSAKITKGGNYYTTDLTKTGSMGEISVGGGSVLTLSAASLTKDTCAKAQTGMYALELKYIANNTAALASVNALLEITDSQVSPEVSVDRTVADKTCKTALELAQNCIGVQNVEGQIVACTVTGNNSTDGNYAIEAGYAIHVENVVVQVKTTLADGKNVISNYTLSVNKTLRNQ